MTARTQDEIVARIGEVAGDDWLGFRREVLIDFLDFEHAGPYLKPEITAEEWDAARAGSADDAARSYLEFAIGKIINHRGISASRSVDELAEYAWLLGRDDVVSAMDSAPYEPYGAPKVRAFATGMGYPWSPGAELGRMADGDPCKPECSEGCSA